MRVFVLILSLSLLAWGDQPVDIDLNGYEYPFSVQRFHFRSQQQDLEMAYMHERSPRPNGQTVVLLHGKNFNGAYWGQTMRALLEAGYEVVVPDQIGFGKSTKPAHYQYTFQQLAHNTAALLDQTQVKQCIVLGHSMGGMVATRFSLMYPERVRQLVLVDPIGLEDWKLKVPYTTIDEWYAQELAKTPEKIKAYQQKSYYGGEWKPAYDRWVYPLAAPLNSPEYPRLAWNNALTYDMIFTQPVCYEFSQLEVPTLLMVGTEDRTALGKDKVASAVAETMGDYPRLARATVAQIPDARLVLFEGLGHLPHIEDFPRFWGELSKGLRN